MTLIAIVIPLGGVIAAPFFVWGWGFHWVDLGLLLGMYLLTALGITVGFHRLFVHRSFDTYGWVKFGWAALGLVLPAVLGGVISLSWAGVWTGLIWGGLVRIFLVHHVTWSVNSACHLWGFRPFAGT